MKAEGGSSGFGRSQKSDVRDQKAEVQRRVLQWSSGREGKGTRDRGIKGSSAQRKRKDDKGIEG